MLFEREWNSIWKIWCVVSMFVAILMEGGCLSGPNVCMVQQKYNITKRVKYRAPMSVRTYVWCFSIPPRCSKWSTEMRDLTRLETEERTAEVAVCCPGYKMKDVTCIPICPSGRTGHGCSEECPPNKWGPNCVNECVKCLNGFCSPNTGECDCLEGWQGESCQISKTTTQPSIALMEELLTTTKSSVQPFSTKSTEPSTLPTTPMSTTSTSSITPSSITTATMLISSTAKLPESISSTTFPTTILTTFISNIYNNVTLKTTTLTTPTTTTEPKNTEEGTNTRGNSFIYNRTELPATEGTSRRLITEHVTSTTMKSSITTKSNPISTNVTYTPTIRDSTTVMKTPLKLEKEIITIEATTARKPEVSTKYSVLTTIKFKPKEIWIKPTQKGDTFIAKTLNDSYNSRHKNEITSVNTTPKTIIVSIIPTSMSHPTFKKIALTTASYKTQKTNITSKFYNIKSEQGFTKSIEPSTSTTIPHTSKLTSPQERNWSKMSSNSTTNSKPNEIEITKAATNKLTTNKAVPETTTPSTSKIILNTTLATSKTTNSMLSTLNEISKKKLNSSTLLTNKPTNKKFNQNAVYEITTKPIFTVKSTPATMYNTFKKTQHALHGYVSKNYETIKSDADFKITKVPFNKFTTKFNTTKKNATKQNNLNLITTEEPNEETFHILTEPEHITAVMTDKERDHSSVDLISVISIAGGVMMAVITVAVVIVMVERCKRPNYEDAMKMNNFRNHSMMDNDDAPPPYVRSIFHTPLPEPPMSEKCHYQPISTLDRNLKQFMRPVVVQAISPVMLENFRGILECHYDHLPRRNHDFESSTLMRSSVSPSMNNDEDFRQQRPLSVAETIEALKCEAKFDVLDTTTSEPLYAEIPCWRPPSEHAIEILNLNGEAVTEL